MEEGLNPIINIPAMEFLNAIKRILGLLPKVKGGYRKVSANKTQFWYGRVNKWVLSRKTSIRELDLMAKSGCTGYLIEMAGGAGIKAAPWTDAWVEEIESHYKWLLRECRARKLWLFVSVVNDNMGQGKHGDKNPKLEKVYQTALKLLDVVKRHGSKGVYVQPVAETQTKSGEKYEQEAIRKLSGFNLVYNGNYGSPSKPISGMGDYAVHPARIDEKNPKSAFVVSDHSNTIREMNRGGSLEAKGDPAKVSKWAANVKKTGCPVCAYYGFLYEGLDKETIETLGTAGRD